MLDNSDCLKEEQMLLYIQGKLNFAEQNKAERHLLDCELCSDALDGLRLIPDENISRTIASLNQQIDNRVKQKEVKIIPFYSWVRIAAVLVLITISGGLFLYLQKEQKQDEKIVADKIPSLPPTPQNNFEVKSAEPALTETTKEIASKDFKAPLTTIQKNKTEDVSAPKSTSISSYDAVEENKIQPPPQAVTDQQEVAETFAKKENKVAEKQTVATEQPSPSEGSAAGNARALGVMKANSKLSLENQQQNSAIIISNAKIQMENNQFDSANFLFDQVINNNDTKYMEEALWNKAITLEKLNRRTESKNILQRIVTINGKYKKKATEKLKE